MNIVYIEDNPDDARLVKLYVDSTEHSIVVATQRDEAKTALSQDPDLVLLDILLWYSREGHEFARDLRQRGYSRPIIAVTGLATRRDQAECRRAGFTDILIKPFTISQLADVIERYSK
jgi:CheY-like chemotaxis protein